MGEPIASQILNLTEITIRNLRAPEKGATTYFDDGLKGFGVRVSQGGTKSYVLIHGSNRRRVKIGRCDVIKLGDARSAARSILANRTLGKHSPTPKSFETALAEFLETRPAKNKPSTVKSTTRVLNKHFLPRLRRERMNDIRRDDIADILKGLRHTPGEQNHAFAIARLFFRWAEREQIIDRSPCTLMQMPSPIRSRDRVLDDEELRKIVATAQNERSTFHTIVLLLLLTGQRRGEIAALTGTMVDLEKDLITFPKELTKNRRPHTFPIGPMAHDLFKDAYKEGLLFQARGSDGPFSGWSKCKMEFDKACGATGWTLHDLRRTFATGLASLGTPIHVTEKILNHVTGTMGGIVSVYQRFRFLDEQRHAIEAWEAKLTRILDSHSARQ